MNNLFFKNNSNVNYTDKLSVFPEERGLSSTNSSKFNFNTIKCNTCRSLYEVEYFLNNFKKFTNCIKLYKILK